MKKGHVFVLSLLLVISLSPAAADNLTDDQVLYKFAVYTTEVYLGNALKGMDINQLSPSVAARIFTPRLMGYSLGNLLRYAPTGSENHRIWQMLEGRVRKTLFELIDLQAAQERRAAGQIQVLKEIAAQEFAWAIEHRYDVDMARAYGVKPDQAPDFFATLTTTPPQPPIQQPPADPPPQPPIDLSDPLIQNLLQPAPPVQPPAPVPPSGNDAVAGVYKVVGQSWENDPNCGSEVTLTGSMNEVEAEFKLWDRTGITWHYKGPAKWDGKTWTDVRELKGKTQWLKYPHMYYGLEIKAKLGPDGRWRADSINIGGNLFMLAPSHIGRPVDNRAKTLTVKNKTAARVTIYLDESEYGLTTMLGSVEPGSNMKFVGIPHRGSRYLKIVPAPDTYPYMYTEWIALYDSQFDYFFEVLEWHLKQR